MNTYKNQPFLVLFMRFYLPFFIVVVLFKTGLITLKSGFSAMRTEMFELDKLRYFLAKIALMSLFYALFMTIYYKFIKK